MTLSEDLLDTTDNGQGVSQLPDMVIKHAPSTITVMAKAQQSHLYVQEGAECSEPIIQIHGQVSIILFEIPFLVVYPC